MITPQSYLNWEIKGSKFDRGALEGCFRVRQPSPAGLMHSGEGVVQTFCARAYLVVIYSCDFLLLKSHGFQ
jgi:hypothetical protein